MTWTVKSSGNKFWEHHSLAATGTIIAIAFAVLSFATTSHAGSLWDHNGSIVSLGRGSLGHWILPSRPHDAVRFQKPAWHVNVEVAEPLRLKDS